MTEYGVNHNNVHPKDQTTTTKTSVRSKVSLAVVPNLLPYAVGLQLGGHTQQPLFRIFNFIQTINCDFLIG